VIRAEYECVTRTQPASRRKLVANQYIIIIIIIIIIIQFVTRQMPVSQILRRGLIIFAPCLHVNVTRGCVLESDAVVER